MLNRNTIAICLLLLAALYLTGAEFANAQSSLGLGRSEQAVRPEGAFAELLFWIQSKQQAFYQEMTQTLKSMRDEGKGVWLLVGLSFAYGVFHAAGPGHGKAVITSYMLANEVVLRRGIVLSFASAFLQGLVGILLISALIFVLRGTGIRTDTATGAFEIASYAFVTFFGGWLLWRKLFKKQQHAHHHHAHGDHACGHSHGVEPSKLDGPMNLRDALLAVGSVGIRPCTGAIIVLTFAFLNGLYLGGVLSVAAMSFGTGLTVSALAVLAVSAKNLAIRFAGAEARGQSIVTVIEILGALFLFGLGLVLLLAALQA